MTSIPSNVPNENRGVIASQNFLSRNIVARIVRPPELDVDGMPATELPPELILYKERTDGKTHTASYEGADSAGNVSKAFENSTNVSVVGHYTDRLNPNIDDDLRNETSEERAAAKKPYFRALQAENIYGMSIADFHSLPERPASAIWIPSAERFISTPYVPPDTSLSINTLANYTGGKTPGDNPNATIYMWSVKYPKGYTPITNDPRDPTGVYTGFSQKDGIAFDPQSRSAPQPMYPLELDPSAFDPHVPPNALDRADVGAFVLTLSVTSGRLSGTKGEGHWDISIKFGEVQITILEESASIFVRIGDQKRQEVNLFSSAGESVARFGPNPLSLCVIPVVGGLLLSDKVPSADATPVSVSYVRGRNLSIQDYIDGVMTRPDKQETNKKKDKKQKTPRDLPLNVLPVKYSDVEEFPTDPPKRDLFGIRVQDKKPIDIKGPIEITYHRCGGQIKFDPVYFLPNARVHSKEAGDPADAAVDLYQLELQPCDAANDILEDCDPNGSKTQPQRTSDIKKKRQGLLPIEELPVAKNVRILGITAWPSRYGLRQRSRMYVLPSDGSNVATDVLIDVRRPTPAPAGQPSPDPDQDDEPADKTIDAKYIRRPVEFFGYIIYRYAPQTKAKDKDKKKNQNSGWTLRNGERFLYLNEIPEQRIRSISISRNLEGSSGSITWDRYDPQIGLYPRPDQFAASLSLAVEGGNDVTPGDLEIFWTGLAIGNAVVNNENTNEVKTNLFGREFKLGDKGLHIVNAPYFDAWDHIEVMKWMTAYSGVPLNNLAKPYRLPASFAIRSGASVVDFTTGTPVWGAISEIGKLAGTLAYFDRFGRLTYIEQDRTTGTNWDYPDTTIESYDDEPDLSSMANSLVVTAMIADKNTPPDADVELIKKMSRPVMLGLRLNTYPDFEWDKMVHYPVNAVFHTIGEFNRVALRIAREISRPRAAGSVTIPGNARIELLDTINGQWLITGISHSLDTQAKSFRTNLALEYIQTGDLTGIASYLPLPSVYPSV